MNSHPTVLVCHLQLSLSHSLLLRTPIPGPTRTPQASIVSASTGTAWLFRSSPCHLSGLFLPLHSVTQGSRST